MYVFIYIYMQRNIFILYPLIYILFKQILNQEQDYFVARQHPLNCIHYKYKYVLYVSSK